MIIPNQQIFRRILLEKLANALLAEPFVCQCKRKTLTLLKGYTFFLHVRIAEEDHDDMETQAYIADVLSPILIKNLLNTENASIQKTPQIYLNTNFFEHGSTETLTYTLAVISSLALYEYPSSVEGIVAECGLRTFSGIHRWKHEDWMSMT